MIASYYQTSKARSLPLRPDALSKEAADLIIVGLQQDFITVGNGISDNITLAGLIRPAAHYQHTFADTGEYIRRLGVASLTVEWRTPLSTSMALDIIRYLDKAAVIMKGGRLGMIDDNPDPNHYLAFFPLAHDDISQIGELFGWYSLMTNCHHLLELGLKKIIPLAADGVPTQALSLETIRLQCFVCVWGERIYQVFRAQKSATATTTDFGLQASVEKFREKLTEFRAYLRQALAILVDKADEYAILPTLLQSAFEYDVQDEQAPLCEILLKEVFCKRVIRESALIALTATLKTQPDTDTTLPPYYINEMNVCYQRLALHIICKLTAATNSKKWLATKWLTLTLEIYLKLFEHYAQHVLTLESPTHEEKTATHRQARIEFLTLFPENVGGLAILKKLQDFVEQEEGNNPQPGIIYAYASALPIELKSQRVLLGCYEIFCEAERKALTEIQSYYRFPDQEFAFKALDYDSLDDNNLSAQVDLHLKELTHVIKQSKARLELGDSAAGLPTTTETLARACCFMFLRGIKLQRALDALLSAAAPESELNKPAQTQWVDRSNSLRQLLQEVRALWYQLVSSPSLGWASSFNCATAFVHLSAAFDPASDPVSDSRSYLKSPWYPKALLLPGVVVQFRRVCEETEYYGIMCVLMQLRLDCLLQSIPDASAGMDMIERINRCFTVYEEYERVNPFSRIATLYGSSFIENIKKCEAIYQQQSTLIKEFVSGLKKICIPTDPPMALIERWTRVKALTALADKIVKRCKFEIICFRRLQNHCTPMGSIGLGTFNTLYDHYFDEGGDALTRIMLTESLFFEIKDVRDERIDRCRDQLHLKLRSAVLAAEQGKASIVAVLKAAWLLKQFVRLDAYLMTPPSHLQITRSTSNEGSKERFIKILEANQRVFGINVFVLFAMRMQNKCGSADYYTNEGQCWSAWQTRFLQNIRSCAIMGPANLKQTGYVQLAEAYCQLSNIEMPNAIAADLEGIFQQVCQNQGLHWNTKKIQGFLQAIDRCIDRCISPLANPPCVSVAAKQADEVMNADAASRDEVGFLIIDEATRSEAMASGASAAESAVLPEVPEAVALGSAKVMVAASTAIPGEPGRSVVSYNRRFGAMFGMSGALPVLASMPVTVCEQPSEEKDEWIDDKLEGEELRSGDGIAHGSAWC